MAIKTIIMSLVLICSSSISFANDYVSGSARHSGSSAESERSVYEAESNKILDNIYAKFDETYYSDAIKRQGVALKNYANMACAVVGYSSGSGGVWPSTYALKCETGIAYHYNLSLKKALSCIERLEKQSYIPRGAKMNCVIQVLNTKFF